MQKKSKVKSILTEKEKLFVINDRTNQPDQHQLSEEEKNNFINGNAEVRLTPTDIANLSEQRRNYKIKKSSLLICTIQVSSEIINELKGTDLYANDLAMSMNDVERRMVKWLDKNIYLNQNANLTGAEVEASFEFTERIKTLFETQYEIIETIGSDPEVMSEFKSDYKKLLMKYIK